MSLDPRLSAMQKVMNRWSGGDSDERLVVFSDEDWLEVTALLEPLLERFGEDRISGMGHEDGDDRYLFIDAPISTAELGALVGDLVRGQGFTATVEQGLEYMAAGQQVRILRSPA
jgi:hypothetical protein